MAYFNHAFTKRFLGTQVTGNGTGENPNTNMTNGFITTAGIASVELGTVVGSANSIYGVGSYGFFTPNNYLSVDFSYASTNSCCPLILASASLMTNDKIGPFHGGYKESNKSKLINPKYISKAYVVEECAPQQSVTSVGHTPGSTGAGVATIAAPTLGTETYVNGSYTNIVLTGGTGSGALASVTVAGNAVTVVTITQPGSGYTVADVLTLTSAAVATPGALTELVAGTATTVVASTVTSLDPNKFLGGTGQGDCCYEFLCGETYYLRVDVKGSPALRYLNHNAYQTLSAYTGCCSGPTPTAVDSTLVMIEWANQIAVGPPYLSPFIFPIVYDEAGVAWFPPNSTVDPQGNAIIPSQWWSAYVSPGHVDGECAGLRLFGAYVATQFGNCSFQITDFFEKEPVQIFASLVDYNGDPCVFEGICVYQECTGLQGMGFGEQVVRDLILSESYLQNFFSTDIRIREITQGNDILNSVNRNALYTRYFILHNVPRFNNPTGVFDNDQYMLEIISTGRNAALELFLTTWLENCANCVPFEVFDCTPCVVAPI